MSTKLCRYNVFNHQHQTVHVCKQIATDTSFKFTSSLLKLSNGSMKVLQCDAKRKKMQSSGQLFRACWPSSAEHTVTSLSGIKRLPGAQHLWFWTNRQDFTTGMCWPSHTFVVWSLGPSPIMLVKASTEPKLELAILACRWNLVHNCFYDNHNNK